jgi:GNAT superfamily N-acetyltransferase
MRFPSEAAFAPVEIQAGAGRTLQVREYTVGDFHPLVEMYRSFEPKRIAQGLPPPDGPRIEEWLNRLQHKSRALLAWDGPTVAVHAILCPMSEAAVEFTVFVHQDYRRAGLGTALTRQAVALAERCGFAEVFLTTELSNLAALRVYRRVGFQTTSSFGDECEMKLVIAASSSPRARAA